MKRYKKHTSIRSGRTAQRTAIRRERLAHTFEGAVAQAILDEAIIAQTLPVSEEPLTRDMVRRVLNRAEAT
jgi:hypothetical protein